MSESSWYAPAESMSRYLEITSQNSTLTVSSVSDTGVPMSCAGQHQTRRTSSRHVPRSAALVQRYRPGRDVLRHCRRTVAAVAAAVAAAAVGLKWKMTCKVLLSVFPCSHFSLSPPGTFPVSRTSCAALVAARHTLRRSRAVCKCGPLLTRTHHALRHHVMCLVRHVALFVH